MRKLLIGLSVALLLVILPGTALAQSNAETSVEKKTREILIKKLTQVYLNLAPQDSSKTAITLRLADLHAERARIMSMEELSEGCTKCVAGLQDRTQALRYYNEALANSPEASRAKILTQVGHLYELTGRESDAIGIYEKIIRDEKATDALADAHLSLAEVFFKRRSYLHARSHFEKVLTLPQAGSRGLAAYRIAWCDFNDGRVQAAVERAVQILKTPALLSRSASADVVSVDPQFHEEVSRDLATFLTKRKLTLEDGELVFGLSPQNAKIANVTYLASEAERVGQTSASIALWKFANARQSQPRARLEGHVHLAALEMNQRLTQDAVKDFESALSLWPEVMGACQGDHCKELHSRLRNFIVDWNKVEKKQPSLELLTAYSSYLKVFPKEPEMTIWAAQVAMELKNYQLAAALYDEGANLAAKENSENLEAALLGAIETAELSKDKALLHKAYDSYISRSKVKTKTLEVRYQKAHLLYDSGENEAAAQALRSIAMTADVGGETIRKQAADLSLDALVLLKDDQRLEAWSADYARVFPKAAQEFSGISRKSVLTQSAHEASAGNAAALTAAWATLSRFDLASAGEEERITYFKNKLILAEKMQKFAEAREAADQLLKITPVHSADQQYALARKAWLAELQLDFTTALAATQKISTPEFKGETKWLKLAMYAELAAKDAKPFYSEFLKDSRDDDKKAAVAAQLVREAKDSVSEIERQRKSLEKRPELLATLYMEVVARKGQLDLAKKVLAQKNLVSTNAGRVLQRAVILDESAKLRARIEGHQIDSSNQKKLSSTLKARVAMLEDIEKLASRAVEAADLSSQIVALDLLAKQNERFYQEVLSLPVPQGLSAEDEQQYLTLLSQQAAPHQVRASDVSKKVTEFWQNSATIAAIENGFTEETGARKQFLIQEIKALSAVAPENQKTILSALAEKPEAKRELPQQAALEKARQAVRENPLSRSGLEDLLVLEKQMNHAPMVVYLEGRINSLEEKATVQTGAQ